METTYFCESPGRVQAVRASTEVNGIEFVEVDETQLLLRVHFVHDLPGTGASEVPAGAPALEAVNFVIEGGVRVLDPTIVAVAPGPQPNVLQVTADAAGDFSNYLLRLVAGPGETEPPAGFDPRLSQVVFGFKAACPSEFDCIEPQRCPPTQRQEPEIDYLNKDYTSFRRLMLERLAVTTPDWTDRNAADLQVTMVEMLAYVGDQLSYQQDAVANEAYLGTARRRVSVRRHARFLDYFMHEGCNARTWLVFEVDGAVPLPAGTAVCTGREDLDRLIEPHALARFVAETRPAVFETVVPAMLRPGHHRIELYTWSDDQCCLANGSVSATLLNEPPLTISTGDVVLFEEIAGPETGFAADRDPTHRHAVRVTGLRARTDPVTGTDVIDIRWSEEDALPFALCITTQVINEVGGIETVQASVARANVVLADHGYTPRSEVTGDPAPEYLGEVPVGRAFRPRVSEGPLTMRAPVADLAASRTLTSDPTAARAAVEIEGGGLRWAPVFDLLASDRFETDCVVEFDNDRTATIRFGDDVRGRAPSPGNTLQALYRVGSGRAGNVGADQLRRVALGGPAALNVVAVRNPLPAQGGLEPESIDRVRYAAPQAMRTQRRAVTEQDYSDAAAEHPAVQKARARFRWTGSWYTVFVAIDPVGGASVDEDLAIDLRRRLDIVRMMGHDLEITSAVYVPLDVALHVCVHPGHYRSEVAVELFDALGSKALVDGSLGLFHVDNFSFGDAVYLSRIHEAAMGVPGVATVNVTRFRRWGEVDRGELAAGVIRPADKEIARLDNDPSFPEMGHLDLVLDGGL